MTACWRIVAAKARQNPQVIGAAPFVAAQGLASHGQAMRGAVVRGISPADEASVTALASHLRSGALDRLQPGGWGVLLKSGGTEKELFGGELGTTNNRMEMMAVIQALQALKRPCEVTLYLDSQYVLKGITEWLPGWKAKGWRTASKQPVKNVELWQQLDALVSKGGHKIDWRWVRKQNDNHVNEKAENLARRGVDITMGRA